MIDINKICYFSQKNIKIKELLTNILSDYKTTIVVANPRKIIITVDRKNIYQLNGVVRETETLEKLYGAVLFFKKMALLFRVVSLMIPVFSLLLFPKGPIILKQTIWGI